MTTRMLSLCQACTRLDGDSCEAFPEGVPERILVFGEDHRKPTPGDHGLVFELDKSKTETLKDWLER